MVTCQKLPVLFLIFCREDLVRQSIESIRAYQPEKFYIAADGPRINKQGETELCENTRKAVLNAIDWPCEVKTLFREKNLGCANAVSGAVTWFFENEEYGIIIEDDVLIHPDFYRLCEQFLPYYKDEDRVMLISAENACPDRQCANELVFTNRAWIWGWASWRRAWAKMDMTMSHWQQFNPLHLIKRFGLFQGLFFWYYWSSADKNIATLNSWATRWDFALTVNDGLCLSSNSNLSKNIGIGNDNGTHYSKEDTDIYAHLSFGGVKFPLQLPERIELTRKKVNADKREFMRIRWIGLKKKIKKLFINR